jgi:hypothetical protein
MCGVWAFGIAALRKSLKIAQSNKSHGASDEQSMNENDTSKERSLT